MFIILLSVIASLLLAGKLLDRCYKKFWWPFFDKLNVVIKDSTYYDGIYLGNSKVNFGINPYYVDSVTSLKTYNAGMGGAQMTEINFLLKRYLQKHPAPKFVVLSVDYSTLMNRGRFFQNPCYYFFFTGDSAVNSILQDLHYHTILYKILPVLKYTAFDDFNKFSIAGSLQGNTIVQPGGVVYNGFINNKTNSFNPAELKNSSQTDTTYNTGLQLFEESLRLIKEKNVAPILIYPPAINVQDKRKNSFKIKVDSMLSLIANKYNAPILHYDNDTSFTNDLFTDGSHLNINGCILYSKKLGADIRFILQNSR